MFKLLRLAIVVVVVAYLWMIFPNWVKELSVSNVIEVIESGVERIIELAEKLN